MRGFFLTLTSSASFGLDAPNIDILIDGVIFTSFMEAELSGTGSSTNTFFVEYDGAKPTSISAQINDASAEIGRVVQLDDVLINGRDIRDATLVDGEGQAANFDFTANIDFNLTNTDWLFGQSVPSVGLFGTATYTGTAAMDSHNGSKTELDIIDMGDGHDTVNGNQGDDVIFGGLGNDLLVGADGVDLLVGGEGNDTLRGQLGDDILYGGDGDDKVYGNEGNDTLNGGAGNDLINGFADNDLIFGGAGVDKLYGGTGDDRIFGGDDKDFINGEDGNDIIDGGLGDDIINTGAGDDTVEAGEGNDRIYGELGADIINAGAGIDKVYGGEGNDVISGGEGNDRLEGNEGDDIINGDNGQDFLFGGDGNDTLNGGGLADILRGENGDDIINGGDHNDYGYGGDGSDTIHGDDGSDRLYGEEGDDFLYGDRGSDFMYGGNGNDFMDGGAGADRMYGHDGADIVNGGSGDDFIDSGDGNDVVNGDAGNDIIAGGAGNDTLSGDDGNDTLLGGNGDDILMGGAGDDILYGATIIGESGVVAESQASSTTWHTVTFSSAILNPVVKMSSLSNNSDPFTVRVRDVTDSGFQWQIDEWDYLDGVHGVETFSWMAIAEGTHVLDNGVVVQAGTTTAEDRIQSNVTFDAAFSNTPIVVSQVMSDNDSGAVISRNRNITSTGFQTSMQEEKAADDIHGTETIGWIAIEQSGSPTDGFYVDQTSRVVTHAGTDIDFPTAFSNTPVFLHDMQTLSGGDPSYSSASVVTDTGATVYIQEEASNGSNNNHPAQETIGFFALNEGLLTAENGGDNTLSGGAGLDTLFGGDGADTFVFEAAHAYTDTDILADFSAGEGDVLDLSDLISGFSGNIEEYLSFDDSSGTDTVIMVDGDGLAGGVNFQAVGVINGITGLDEATLFANNNIIV